MLTTQFQLLFSNKYILNYRLVMGKKKEFPNETYFFFCRKEEKCERSRYYFLNLDMLKYVKIK